MSTSPRSRRRLRSSTIWERVSLAIVELVLAFEEQFEIDIPDEDTEKIRTVGDAISYIQEHNKLAGACRSGSAGTHVSWQDERIEALFWSRIARTEASYRDPVSGAGTSCNVVSDNIARGANWCPFGVVAPGVVQGAVSLPS